MGLGRHRSPRRRAARWRAYDTARAKGNARPCGKDVLRFDDWAEEAGGTEERKGLWHGHIRTDPRLGRRRVVLHLVEAELLFHQDVPPELASEALKRGREQSEARMGEASPLDAWPDVPTRVLLCRDNRLFPAGFLRRVARERLGITPDEKEGGHTPALRRPKELAERLEAFAADAGVISG